MRPFFDTNVLVYAFDEGEPEKSRARRPPRPLPVDEAHEAMRYFAAFSPIPEDARMVLGAISRSREYTLSFWDALIVEAAISRGAKRLLTEDLPHGQVIEGLEVENPFLQ